MLTFLADTTCRQRIPVDGASGYADPKVGLLIVFYEWADIREPIMEKGEQHSGVKR
jgi:hypothetical protein